MTTLDQNTDSKVLIDEACRTAKAFVDRYYDKVDSKRPTLSKIYLDAATLSWNGNRIDGKVISNLSVNNVLYRFLFYVQGPEDIQKFYQEKLPPSSHQIYTFDAQPVLDEFVGGQKTVAVHVGGSVKFGVERPRPFQQNFLLTASGDFWKVATDVFRYQEPK